MIKLLMQLMELQNFIENMIFITEFILTLFIFSGLVMLIKTIGFLNLINICINIWLVIVVVIGYMFIENTIKYITNH